MKPLHLLAIIEATSITGPAKNLLEFTRLAKSEGVETTFATFVRGEASNLFVQTARGRSITVNTVQERSPYDRGTIGTLARLVSHIRPDVIQTHAVKSHFLARMAGLPQRAPWIAFHHGYTWPAWRTRLYNELDRWSLRTAVKVLTVSGPFQRELKAKGVRSERIEVIHNAIRPDWGSEASRPDHAAAFRAALNITPAQKVMLIVGRLSREKDHITLLEALNLLRPGLFPLLIIVGEGPERIRIEKKIRALGLEQSVLLTGQQKSAEQYYGIADVAILSSLTEGSPNALLEAMAARVPVVATAVGGIPEIVTHGQSALLVKPGDARSMAQSIAQLLENEDLAQSMVKQGHQLITERYSPEQRTHRLIEVYHEAVRLGKVH
jgi:glycosyltransferase involved in cell wall biosynthesis